MPQRSTGLVNVPFFGFYNTNHLQLLVGNIIRVRLGDVQMGHFTTPVMSVWAEGPRKQDVQKFRVSGS